MYVLTLAGSPSQRSRSGVLLEFARQWLQERGIEWRAYQVRDFNAEDLLHARFDSPQVVELIEQVARADGLVIATPVYKASLSGALKVVLDLLPERALSHKVVLPLATGGSSAHMLAVDYALKPVLAALKAQETLHGVFAEDNQIEYATADSPARLAPVLERRLLDALEQFQHALSRRPKPIDPNLLNERLLKARWSI
ncbi:MAG: FMN reductase (NADPH) [Pseudomonas citronellolis]|nr:MAG: FMN reductase (NADPH) [Pseudomonas citronellolis]